MKCKSFFAVVAAALHQFVVFSLFLISNLSIFLISYLRGPEINTAITRELRYFLSPIASLTMSSKRSNFLLVQKHYWTLFSFCNT